MRSVSRRGTAPVGQREFLAGDPLGVPLSQVFNKLIPRLFQAPHFSIEADNLHGTRRAGPMNRVLWDLDDRPGPYLVLFIADALIAVARNAVDYFRRISMPVLLMRRSGGEERPPETHFVGPYGLTCDQEANIHVPPSVLLPDGRRRDVVNRQEKFPHVRPPHRPS